MNNYIVPLVDLADDKIPFTYLFQATDLISAEDKVMEYIQREWDWDEDIRFPYEYRNFISFLKLHKINIGEIRELDL